MSGERKGPQARDRVLGARLRAIRKEQTDLSLEAAADRAQWSPSTLSRIETGKRHISSEDVATLLALYGVPVEQRDELVGLARTGNTSGWWDSPLPGVPQEIGTYASYEADATHLTNWSQSVVPGLLQTYDYAAGYMQLDGVPTREIETRWMVRLRRQQVLNSVEYGAYIGEPALRTPFGGAVALRRQLEHMYQVYDRGLVIRVVPQGAPVAALLHSWMLMEYSDAGPVVSVELMRSAVYLHDKETEVYLSLRAKLDALALSAPASRVMISETIGRS